MQPIYQVFRTVQVAVTRLATFAAIHLLKVRENILLSKNLTCVLFLAAGMIVKTATMFLAGT